MERIIIDVEDALELAVGDGEVPEWLTPAARAELQEGVDLLLRLWQVKWSGYRMVMRRVVWWVELGYIDGGGVGRWEGTIEAVACRSHTEAVALRDAWLASGKLEQTRWGGYRPAGQSYGAFRIRQAEEEL